MSNGSDWLLCVTKIASKLEGMTTDEQLWLLGYLTGLVGAPLDNPLIGLGHKSGTETRESRLEARRKWDKIPKPVPILRIKEREKDA